VRRKAEGLGEFDAQGLTFIKGWLNCLLPALDHFVKAAEGEPDIAFWGSVCNLSGLSGMVGSPVTGWISVFFPYLAKGSPPWENQGINWTRNYEFTKKNGVEAARELVMANSGSCAWMKKQKSETTPISGIELADIPTGMLKAPVHVKWIDVGKESDLEFCGGIFAIHQHPDGALEPRTGWVVVEKP
jgi:hypothetical protein